MFIIENVMNTDCNLKCYFCFAKGRDSNYSSSLNLEKVLENLKSITNENFILVKFYGGEVLLHQDKFVEQIKLIEKYQKIYDDLNIRIALITNLTVYPNEFIINKLKNGEIDLSVSMEGNKELHDNIRLFHNNKGSFDTVINNILRLNKETGIKVGIQTVLSKEIVNNIDKYIKFIQTYSNVAYFSFSPMFGVDEIDEELLAKLPNTLGKLRKYLISSIKNNEMAYTSFHEMRSLLKLISIKNPIQINNSKHCLAGVEQISLIGDKFYPCSRFFHNDYKFMNYNSLEEYKLKKEIFEDLSSFDQECINCQIENNMGCIGKCMVSDLMNGGEKVKNVCRYNIIFGKHSIEFIKDLYNEIGIEYIKSEIHNVSKKNINKIEYLIKDILK